jgi:hypothetical protein
MGKSHEEFIRSIRAAMRDDDPSRNRLLDKKLEFTDADIADALDYALDRFNTMPPFTASWTCETVPDSSVLIDLSRCELLTRSLMNRIRNQLEYQSGGTSVNIDGIAGYDNAMKTMYARAEERAQALKAQINFNRGFGRVSTPYADEEY